MMTRHGYATHRGFTLVEILISLVILSLGLVSMSQLYVAAMWTTQKARYLSLATQRAQFEYENVQSLGAAALMGGPNDEMYDPTEYQFTPSVNRVDFQVESLPESACWVTWANYPATGTGFDQQVKVDIVISWLGPRKSRSDVTLSTLLTNTE